MAAVSELLAGYRRLGADPPFGDPLLGHGVGMEGYYWRFSDAASGRVVVALCGVCRDEAGPWAAVALAVHPERVLEEGVVAPAVADPAVFGARAGEAFAGSVDGVRVALGAARAEIDVGVDGRAPWPRRAFGALGPAHWVPGLGQYWHPWLLGGVASGSVRIGATEVSVDGWRVYAEKNWGSAFPRRWWWGQAHDFGGEDVCLAFAGGTLGLGVHATGVVVRIGRGLVRLALPAAIVRTSVDGRTWSVRGRGGGWSVVVEGDGGAPGGPGAPGATGAYMLPVPVPGQRRVVPRAAQHLAARVSLTVRRRGRVRFAGESALAGLEYGT